MLKERAGASTSLQAVCSRGSIPARTPAGSPELRTLGASVVLTAVDAAGAMSRGWERKKARLFEHYMALMIEQVASKLPSLPPRGLYTTLNCLCVLVFLPEFSAVCGNGVNFKVNRKLNPSP